MTSLPPIAEGLRHVKNVRIYRDVVNDYVLPVTAADVHLSQAEAAQASLAQELAISADSQSRGRCARAQQHACGGNHDVRGGPSPCGV